MSKVITVTAGKGGTGRTTTVAAISSCLAALGYKTLCTDFDRDQKDLEAALGLFERQTPDARDTADGRHWISKACREHPRIPNLFYLSPTAYRETDRAGETDAAVLFGAIRREFDYCIVDAPAVTSPSFKSAHAGADMSIIISNCDLPTMSDVHNAASRISEAGVKYITLLVNRFQQKYSGWIAQCVEDVTESRIARLIGVIPEDKIIFQALHMNIPLVLFYKRFSAYHFLDAARRLTGKEVPSRIRLGIQPPVARQASPQKAKTRKSSSLGQPPKIENAPEVEYTLEVEQPETPASPAAEHIPELERPAETEQSPAAVLTPAEPPAAEPTPAEPPAAVLTPAEPPAAVLTPAEPPAAEPNALPKTKVRSFGDPELWAKSTLPPCNLDDLVKVFEVKEGLYTGAETIRNRTWLHDLLDDNGIPYHIEIEGYWPGRRKFAERQAVYVEEKYSFQATQLIKEYNKINKNFDKIIEEESDITGIDDGMPQKLCPACGVEIDFDFVVCPHCKARI